MARPKGRSSGPAGGQSPVGAPAGGVSGTQTGGGPVPVAAAGPVAAVKAANTAAAAGGSAPGGTPLPVPGVASPGFRASPGGSGAIDSIPEVEKPASLRSSVLLAIGMAQRWLKSVNLAHVVQQRRALTLLCILYLVVSVPFRYAFDSHAGWQYTDLLVDAVGVLCLAGRLWANTAVEESVVLGMPAPDATPGSKAGPVHLWVSEWSLVVEVLTLLPINRLVAAAGYFWPDARWEVLIALSHWLRVSGIFLVRQQFEVIQLLAPYLEILRLVEMLVYLFVLTHLIACFWFYLGRIEGFASNEFVPGQMLGDSEVPTLLKYWRSLHWATHTASESEPLTTLEMGFHAIVLVISSLSSILVVGQVASLIASHDSAASGFRARLATVSGYLRSIGLPDEQQRQVHQYYMHMWQSFGRLRDEDLLADLNDRMKSEIRFHQNGPMLKKIPIFGKAPDAFIYDLSRVLTDQLYGPGQAVIRQGEIGREMYLVSSGLVEVIGANGRVFTRLQAGSYFGELGVLLPIPRTATAIATTWSCLFVLRQSDLMALLEDYPNVMEEVAKMTIERLGAMQQTGSITTTLLRSLSNSSLKAPAAVKAFASSALIHVDRLSPNPDQDKKSNAAKDDAPKLRPVRPPGDQDSDSDDSATSATETVSGDEIDLKPAPKSKTATPIGAKPVVDTKPKPAGSPRAGSKAAVSPRAGSKPAVSPRAGSKPAVSPRGSKPGSSPRGSKPVTPASDSTPHHSPSFASAVLKTTGVMAVSGQFDRKRQLMLGNLPRGRSLLTTATAAAGAAAADPEPEGSEQATAPAAAAVPNELEPIAAAVAANQKTEFHRRLSKGLVPGAFKAMVAAHQAAAGHASGEATPQSGAEDAVEAEVRTLHNSMNRVYAKGFEAGQQTSADKIHALEEEVAALRAKVAELQQSAGPQRLPRIDEAEHATPSVVPLTEEEVRAKFAPMMPAPYYAVIFTNQRTPGDNGYAETGQRMQELARTVPGYIGVESVRDSAGFDITISYWESEAAILKWKLNAEHREARERGRTLFYALFRLRVVKIERGYDGGQLVK